MDTQQDVIPHVQADTLRTDSVAYRAEAYLASLNAAEEDLPGMLNTGMRLVTELLRPAAAGNTPAPDGHSRLAALVLAKMRQATDARPRRHAHARWPVFSC